MRVLHVGKHMKLQRGCMFDTSARVQKSKRKDCVFRLS